MKIAIIWTILFIPFFTSANVCWKDHDFDLEKAIKQADIAFSGEVTFTKITAIQLKGYEKYIESVQANFDEVKNLPGKKLDPIKLELKGACACRYQFEIGVQYVVLAYQIKSNDHTVRDCKHIFTKENFDSFRGTTEYKTETK